MNREENLNFTGTDSPPMNGDEQGSELSPSMVAMLAELELLRAQVAILMSQVQVMLAETAISWPLLPLQAETSENERRN